MIKCPAGVKDIDQDEVLVEATPDDQCAEVEEGIRKVGFNVVNLRVHGVGALCSFGVAAATFCIFLLGGKQQQQQQRQKQKHKIQLQMCADDEVCGDFLLSSANSAFLIYLLFLMGMFLD
ncbi:uncharacterized protein LOC133914072 [Phragmites australis]|uniref:uncharacterized protein LOC133914072 n=1 Tax=Phragmites australis TaxID=29695 RepID=UPI002D78A3BA|nr:uncharacterized protein LOC133914072 [Phragmites australis]